MLKQNLCFDWRFHYLDRSGPRFMSPAVSDWRVVDLPHGTTLRALLEFPSYYWIVVYAPLAVPGGEFRVRATAKG